MPLSIEAFGIDRLTVRERLELIEQIWDSLPEHVSPDEVPPWHLAELIKRRAEADSSPGEGKPWRDALRGSGTSHESARNTSTGSRRRYPGGARLSGAESERHGWQ